MTVGQAIKNRRKQLGMSRDDLADAIGFSTALVAKIENGQLKNGPNGDQVKKISNVLCDMNIRFAYLRQDPIYKDMIPQVFPTLNNIKTDQSTLFAKLHEELSEATEAAHILHTVFLHAEPREATPNFREVLLSNLEQITDSMRAVEITFIKMIESGVITEHDRREIHIRQQQKCIEHGHHDPSKDVEVA